MFIAVNYTSADNSSHYRISYEQHLHDSPETVFGRVICATTFRTTCSGSCCKLIIFFGCWIFWVRRFDWFDLARLPRAAKMEDATRRYATRYFCQSLRCSCWRLVFICCCLLTCFFFSFFFKFVRPKWLRWLRDAVNWFVRTALA